MRGQNWALRARSVTLPKMLSDEFLQRLHLKMFGDVWNWAGQYRASNPNIGVAHQLIREHLRNVYGDARTWLEQEIYSPEEFAIRLHYRIVSVHPFRKGNGRHARMVAHLTLVRHFARLPLPWGNRALRGSDAARKSYIEALVAADNHNFSPLLEFAMSQ